MLKCKSVHFFPVREQTHQMEWLVCWDSSSVTAIKLAGAERRSQYRLCRSRLGDGFQS